MHRLGILQSFPLFSSIIIRKSSEAFLLRPVNLQSRNFQRHQKVALSLWSDDDNDDSASPSLSMENLYREWTIEQDAVLWKNKDKSPVEIASILGRGIRGSQARLSKLRDVNSPAYERLFANKEGDKHSNKHREENDDSSVVEKKIKLVPAGEVLRRIEWDYMLSSSDFSILHYDRLDDAIIESPLDAPNNSISSGETLLSKALPEHRIVGIKYKDRLVWDRNARMDLVFGGSNGEVGIYEIIETYDKWKRERDQVKEWNRQRQKLAAQRIRLILGLENYSILHESSSTLLEVTKDPAMSTKTEVEHYVQNALTIFRKVRDDPSQSSNPSLIPMSDILALEELSELVSVLPNVELRSMLLTEVSYIMDRIEGKNINKKRSDQNEPIVLSEDDLTETFVRGSGPGGQKINKTSNRVILVHEPTKLRVECQDTRSLQNNRKIARKRLIEKLDEYLNGKQSKVSVKQKKAANKKQKAKAKSRARQRKKQLQKAEEQGKTQQQWVQQEEPNDFY